MYSLWREGEVYTVNWISPQSLRASWQRVKKFLYPGSFFFFSLLLILYINIYCWRLRSYFSLFLKRVNHELSDTISCFQKLIQAENMLFWSNIGLKKHSYCWAKKNFLDFLFSFMERVYHGRRTSFRGVQ